MKNLFLMSGTLGDAFIVILKLYEHYKKKKILLKRISMWPDQDDSIKKVSKIFDFIEYDKPCIKLKKISDCPSIIKKLDLNYVNTSWNGMHFKSVESDFRKLKVTPYPKINIKKNKTKKKKIRVCIQVNSGKIGGNCKIFSNKWISELIALFDPNRYQIYLLGTINNMDRDEIKEITKNKNVNFLVKKTKFISWMKTVVNSDFLISNEGFPAFFAMSQNVRTICFYTDKRILTRIHPAWRKNNLIKSVGWSGVFSTFKVIYSRYVHQRYPLIYPISPKTVYKYINKNNEKNFHI